MFQRRTVVSEEWVLEIKGHIIPLKAIVALTSPVVIVCLIMLAYQVGIQNMSELTKWAAYKGQQNPQGNYVPSEAANQICYLSTSGMTVAWNCFNNSCVLHANNFSRAI